MVPRILIPPSAGNYEFFNSFSARSQFSIALPPLPDA
jgi:hypothetical protein